MARKQKQVDEEDKNNLLEIIEKAKENNKSFSSQCKEFAKDKLEYKDENDIKKYYSRCVSNIDKLKKEENLDELTEKVLNAYNDLLSNNKLNVTLQDIKKYIRKINDISVANELKKEINSVAEKLTEKRKEKIMKEMKNLDVSSEEYTDYLEKNK